MEKGVHLAVNNSGIFLLSVSIKLGNIRHSFWKSVETYRANGFIGSNYDCYSLCARVSAPSRHETGHIQKSNVPFAEISIYFHTVIRHLRILFQTSELVCTP